MRTLDQAIGAWDRKLDSTNGSTGTPFLPAGCNSCVFPRGVGCAPICVGTTYDGVLDLETGLVWQRDPTDGSLSWEDSVEFCHSYVFGGRKGWRLPTLPELASLIDPSVGGLPAGHPFIDVGQTQYHSSTTDVDTPLNAYSQFITGGQGSTHKSNLYGMWCVRGPVNHAGP